MTKRKYSVCEADIQDEFPGYKNAQGIPITGKIYQLEDVTNPAESAKIEAWFLDEAQAQAVADLLNKGD
jgi:hypothetical protein